MIKARWWRDRAIHIAKQFCPLRKGVSWAFQSRKLSSESLMVIRWFRTVIGVVGSSCEGWVGLIDTLDEAIDKSREEVG